MKKYKNFTVTQYLTALSQKVSVPGGGSASALTASTGTALLLMVINYSIGREQPKNVEQKLSALKAEYQLIHDRLIDLIDLDAQAYQQVVDARKGSAVDKRKSLAAARKVPKELSKLCYQAVQKSPYLVKYGNPYLLSDVEVGVEMLFAAYRGALINIKVNQ